VSGCSHEAICPSERTNQSVCSVLSEVRATIRVAGNPGKSARVQIVARTGSARHVGSVGMVQSACDAEHCVRSRVTGTRSGRAPVTGRPIAVIAGQPQGLRRAPKNDAGLNSGSGMKCAGCQNGGRFRPCYVCIKMFLKKDTGGTGPQTDLSKETSARTL